MRRHGLLSLVLSVLTSGFGAPRAEAGVTIDLLFVARNGASITPTVSVAALPGDELVMKLVMTNDEPLMIDAFSLNYDLDNDDELDPLHHASWSGVALNKNNTARYLPLNFAFSVTPQRIGSWVSDNRGSTTFFLPPAAGAYAGGYAVGTVGWKVNAGVNSDGQDIVPALRFGIDAFLGPGGVEITALEFHGATVDAVPEPATSSLLALGLVGVILGRRRVSRRAPASPTVC